ncbi:MAG: hypothetical protein F7C08_00670 [Desulfurococcales archaeon]|nr:hypothetical protein [Desulfurococcales archaeon]
MTGFRLPGYLRVLLQLARQPGLCVEWQGSPKPRLGVTWNDFYMLQAYGMVELREWSNGRHRQGRACLTKKAIDWLSKELCQQLCPALLCRE